MLNNQAKVSITTETNQSVSAVDNLRKRVDGLTVSYQKAGAAARMSSSGAGATAGRLGGGGGRHADLSNTSGLKSGVEGLGSTFSGFSPAVARSSSELSLMNQRLSESSRQIARVNTDIPVMRHALRDTGFTFVALGTAAGAAVGGIARVGAEFETAFTGVERTANLPKAALDNLRSELVQLSTEIPETFANLSSVTTLGGQLGIAGDALGSFSKEVTMFSATTDATIDKTGEGFGRLAQLTDMTEDQFANLSSSIYSVGVSTVATESSILSVAQQISTTGDLAGFSTQEIVGLSGALASLAIQPELARGSMMRIFNAITVSIEESGESLNTLAQLSGMTASEFKQNWANSAGETFQNLLSGMNGVIEQGGNLGSTLKDIGITAGRDKQVMERLANNMDLVSQSMDTASNGWASGTATADAYAKVADNVEAKVQMLKNAMAGLMDSMSNNTSIKLLLDGMIGLVNAIRAVMDTGIGKFLGGLITVFGGAASILFTVRGALMMLQAGFLAMYSYVERAEGSAVKFNLSLGNMTRGFMAMMKPGADAASIIATVGTSAEGSATKMAGAAAMAKGFGSAITGFVGGLARMVPAMAAFWALGEGIKFLSSLMDTPTQKAEKMGISFEGLKDALIADSIAVEEGAKVYATIPVVQDEAAESTTRWSQVLSDVQEAQGGTALATDEATSAVERQTVAVGENAAAWAAKELAGNEGLQDIYTRMGPTLDGLGFSFKEYATAVVEGGPAMDTALQPIQNRINELKEETSLLDFNSAEDAEKIHALSGEIGMLNNIMEELRSVGDATNGGLIEQAGLLEFNAQVMEGFGLAADGTAEGLDGVGDSATGATDSLTDFANSLWDGIDLAAAFESSMYDLGAAIAENGDIVDVTSAAGRDNISAMSAVISSAVGASGGDMNTLSNMLAQALNSIGGTGTAIGRIFAEKGQAILDKMAKDSGQAAVSLVNLAGSMKGTGASASYLEGRMSKLSGGGSGGGGGGRGGGALPRTAKAAKTAAKEVKTLKDYISDLSGVMSRSFELRWSTQEGADSVADQFYDMADALQKAKTKVNDLKQEIKELKAELGTMKSDETTLKYQLNVAQDYGDDLRVTAIEAELTKLRADQAAKTSDLSKKNLELAAAQRETSRSLNGASQESRDQRADVLSLVGAYQDQILALADSGRSQAQVAAETVRLKNQFIAQMIQLGYSRAEALKYAASFGDLKLAIDRVPKKITMSVNMNPAITALNEFVAKAKKSGSDAGSGYGSSFGGGAGRSGMGRLKPKFQNTGSTDGKDYGDLFARSAAMEIETRKGMIVARFKGAVKTAFREMGLGGFATGGFTGRGGENQVAGVVHMGEYVVPKGEVNQATGKPYYMEQGSYTGSYAANAQARGGGNAMVTIVELGPQSIRAIEQSGGAVVMLDSKVLTGAVNQQNVNRSNRGV